MRFFFLLYFIFFFLLPLKAQEELGVATPAYILFYNVENLFDVSNDSLILDDEFTYSGIRHWSFSRMRDKFQKISRVILNVGQWHPPVLVGLCEVENSKVLNLLLNETNLYDFGYRVVHYDSADERGIDVALFYLNQRFDVITSESLPINFGEGERPTRDILYVKGVIDNVDTLHILVNHWSSRYGGSSATQWKREFAAQRLRVFCDSLYSYNNENLIIVMGDFNEGHRSELFSEHLKVGKLENEEVNLISPALYLPANVGSIKFNYHWQLYDQIILSRRFFDIESPIFIEDPKIDIIDFPFLLERDDEYGGYKPFRTYVGMRYNGGFSDHLPVSVMLKVK